MPPATGPERASPSLGLGPVAGSSSTPRDLSAEILSRISDAFFALDQELVVTYFNQGAERQLGRGRDEVLGKPLFDAFPEARGSVFEERYRRALETGEPDAFETFFDVEPYRAWYDVRVYPGHEGLSVYFQVVTQRKEAEEDRSAANQELRAANQQLRATEQQRLASEQQLRAANQQLSATEQQLRAANQQLAAANQQLSASEQQLRAANQQLSASEQQLRAANQQLTLTNKRLRVSQDLLNQTGEMARVGGWEVNLDEGTVSWTHATRLIHEVPEDYVPTVEEAIHFFHPDDASTLESALERAQQEGKPYDLELRFITANGRRLWTRTMGQAKHVEGRCVRLWGTFQDITEKKEAEEALARKTQLLHESYGAIRDLAHRIQAIREQEREELARNLHDDLGETLTVHRMDLVQLRRAAEEAGVPLAESLSDLIESADSAIELTRDYCMRLHSPVLDLMGVGPAIRTHAELVTRKADIELDCAQTDEDFRLGPEVEVNIFRIAQESLTNVLRHSSANRVQIRFGREESGHVRLAVVDDGVGIRADGIDPARSLGILGMKERAMAIGGQLTVETGEEGGTEVHLVIPPPS